MKNLAKKIRGLQYLIDFAVDISNGYSGYYHNPSKQGKSTGIFVHKNVYNRAVQALQFRDNGRTQWHPIFSLSMVEDNKNNGFIVLNKNQEVIIYDVIYPVGMDKDDKFNFMLSADALHLEWYEVLSRIKLPDEVHGFCLNDKLNFVELLNMVDKTKKQYVKKEDRTGST